MSVLLAQFSLSLLDVEVPQRDGAIITDTHNLFAVRTPAKLIDFRRMPDPLRDALRRLHREYKYFAHQRSSRQVLSRGRDIYRVNLRGQSNMLNWVYLVAVPE